MLEWPSRAIASFCAKAPPAAATLDKHWVRAPMCSLLVCMRVWKTSLRGGGGVALVVQAQRIDCPMVKQLFSLYAEASIPNSCLVSWTWILPCSVAPVVTCAHPLCFGREHPTV
ncbi:hypothetical protein RRG08_015225 [Elysia crispata]|uniref:Uncharacterized protein n=1 Tax=Elysia crispata TaxID=231223 RepID=A0AAE1A7Z5_9GAST|nr:hypothetical protein RRG08_015225 [Elysia crispata]